MYQKQIHAMTEVRKTFLMEEEPFRLERDAFKKERGKQRMHRQAFSIDKDMIYAEREAFTLEVSEMAMLREAYLKEKKDRAEETGFSEGGALQAGDGSIQERDLNA